MKKKNIVLIAVVMVVLVAAIAVLAYLNAPERELIAGTLTVVKDGETLATYSMEDIASLEYVEVEYEVVSSSHNNESGLYRGVPLRALLASVDESLLENSVQIVVRAEDNYVTAYSSEEVAESDSILIIYMRDGESLGTMSDGGTGPFRVLITSDEFGTRAAKYLAEIEVV